jgi:hypothetical protein
MQILKSWPFLRLDIYLFIIEFIKRYINNMIKIVIVYVLTS